MPDMLRYLTISVQSDVQDYDDITHCAIPLKVGLVWRMVQAHLAAKVARFVLLRDIFLTLELSFPSVIEWLEFRGDPDDFPDDWVDGAIVERETLELYSQRPDFKIVGNTVKATGYGSILFEGNSKHGGTSYWSESVDIWMVVHALRKSDIQAALRDWWSEQTAWLRRRFVRLD
jgi:hypothetical protein